MSPKHSKSKVTRLLTIVAIVLVIIAGVVLLFKRNIFAEILTTKATSFGVYQANGSHRMAFSTFANFSLSSAYIWWDCQGVQSSDDTLAELTSRCGAPFEQRDDITGSKAIGARLRVFNNNRGAYKVTLPAKTNAKAVYLAIGTDGTSMVKTSTYNTVADRNVLPISGTNSSFRISNSPTGVRYAYEYLNAPDGDLPQNRYYLWWNCDENINIENTVSQVTQACGNPSQTFSVPGDRFYQIIPYTNLTGYNKAALIAQEKKCSTFSYNDESSCSYSTNSFAGSLGYNVIPPTSTPTSTSTTTTVVKLSPTPSPTPTSTSTTTTVVKPTPTPTSTSVPPVTIDFSFNAGFTTFGGTTNITSKKFAENSLTIYKFDGANNEWVIWPGSATKNATGYQYSQFNTKAGEGYYVYSPTLKTVPLPFVNAPTFGQILTKGWNLLYNIGEKDLNTLQLVYGSTVSRSAQELITAGVIEPNIFIIENSQAASSCLYYTLLASTDSAANCSAGSLANVKTLTSGKLFWVYVK